MRVHGNSHDDPSVDECQENIPYFELFVSGGGVTVQQETKRERTIEADSDLIEVVAGVVRLRAIHDEFESRGSEIIDIGSRLLVGEECDCNLGEGGQINVSVLENNPV